MLNPKDLVFEEKKKKPDPDRNDFVERNLYTILMTLLLLLIFLSSLLYFI